MVLANTGWPSENWRFLNEQFSLIFTANLYLTPTNACHYFAFLISYLYWNIKSGRWCQSSRMQFSCLLLKSAISQDTISTSIAATSSHLWLPPSVRPLCEVRGSIRDFRYPHIRKLKSGDLGGHGMSPKRKITLIIDKVRTKFNDFILCN